MKILSLILILVLAFILFFLSLFSHPVIYFVISVLFGFFSFWMLKKDFVLKKSLIMTASYAAVLTISSLIMNYWIFTVTKQFEKELINSGQQLELLSSIQYSFTSGPLIGVSFLIIPIVWYYYLNKKTSQKFINAKE